MSSGRNSLGSRVFGLLGNPNTYYQTDKPLAGTNLALRGADYSYKVKGASSANANIDTIDAPPNGEGHLLILTGTDNTATITVRDDQAGTNIVLGGNARILGDGDTLVLRYEDAMWREFHFKPREGLSAGGMQIITTNVDASAGGTGQTTAIGTIPANAILWDVHARVAAAFDGDTTTTIDVGVSGNADAYIDNVDFDAASIGAQMSMQGGTTNDVLIPEYSSTSRAVIATWTNTASAGAGLVEVTLLYSVLD